MEAPVHGGVVSLDAIRSADMDDDAGVSHEDDDDDARESDRWRLLSDTSTISSRVTTPDPVAPGLPLAPLPSHLALLAPFPSISSRMSQHSESPAHPWPFLPSPSRVGGGMEKGRGHDSDGSLLSRPSPARVPLHDPKFTVPPPVVSVERRRPFSELGTNHQAQTRSHEGENGRVIEKPIGSPPPSQDRDSYDEGETLPQMVMPSAQDAPRSRRWSQKSLFRGRKSDSGDGSENESSSTESSDAEPMFCRNRWQFPPRLPAGLGYGSSGPRSRASVTNQITAWVSRFEGSQSPARSKLDGGGVLLEEQTAKLDALQIAPQHSGDSPHGQVELLWQQLKEKRVRVERIRAGMRAARRELRDVRRSKDAADNAFMSIVRPMLVRQDDGGHGHASAEMVGQRLERMQKARDDYQVLESSYESMESRLDGEEGELGILETQFFSLLATGHSPAEEPRYEQKDESSKGAVCDEGSDLGIPLELRGISRDGPTEEAHPLYAELMSALGNLENAKEEWDDLQCVKEQWERERHVNRTTGQRDVEEMVDFFSELPSEEARMRESVERLEGEVQDLKELCEEKKVMRKHMSIRVEWALNPQIKYHEEDMELEDVDTILSRRGTLAHDEFGELLSQPDHVLGLGLGVGDDAGQPLTALGALKAATLLPDSDRRKAGMKRLAAKEYAIDSLMRGSDGGKRGERVNRWLLHQLRQSAVHAVLLRSTFLARRSLKIRDSWRWQCDVLHYWWRDRTMSDGLSNERASEEESESGSEYSSRLRTPQMSRAASG